MLNQVTAGGLGSTDAEIGGVSQGKSHVRLRHSCYMLSRACACGVHGVQWVDAIINWLESEACGSGAQTERGRSRWHDMVGQHKRASRAPCVGGNTARCAPAGAGRADE